MIISFYYPMTYGIDIDAFPLLLPVLVSLSSYSLRTWDIKGKCWFFLNINNLSWLFYKIQKDNLVILFCSSLRLYGSKQMHIFILFSNFLNLSVALKLHQKSTYLNSSKSNTIFSILSFYKLLILCPHSNIGDKSYFYFLSFFIKYLFLHFT